MKNAFHSLINHALKTHLIEECDKTFIENAILARLGCCEMPDECEKQLSPVESLSVLSEYAAKKGIIENTLGERDIFETELAGIITPRPSEIIRIFNSLFKESPEKATNWFFALCKNNNYIRCEDIAKNLEWTTDTAFGKIEITINLSKPEKDPRDIARAANAASSNYPKCALCPENEGYRGHANHPARSNLRIIPITLQGREWGFQYSPYAYFNEHSIALSREHVPMAIHRRAFASLLDFVDLFPHYFIGSNADLPIVGGSILSHEHYQCGRHVFPMMSAKDEFPLTFNGFENLACSKVYWPMPTVRIKGCDKERIVSLADKILSKWREWTDEQAFVFAVTDNTPHNTITPIAWREGEKFVLDLVLRNNITTDEHPLGVFHPHADKHNIKKENIGLIEVMGMAILPARLKKECDEINRAIKEKQDVSKNELIKKHCEWIERNALGKEDEKIPERIREAIGKTFLEVLIDAAVYKPNEEGKHAFLKFIDHVNK